MPKLNADHRRALALLAESADGCAEAMMRARGFKLLGCISELVDAGLATARAERMHAGGRPIDVNRIQITDAGRVALAEGRSSQERTPPGTGRSQKKGTPVSPALRRVANR
jgi:hypothetical protein